MKRQYPLQEVEKEVQERQMHNTETRLKEDEIREMSQEKAVVSAAAGAAIPNVPG